MTQAQIAKSVGCEQPRISKAVSLLDLPLDVQWRISTGELTAGHGHRLATFSMFPDFISALAELAVKKNLPVSAFDPQRIYDLVYLKELEPFVRRTNYATKFDWKDICPKCPFAAWRSSTLETSYCLNPAHYDQLNDAAIEKFNRDSIEAAAKAREAFVKPLPVVQLPAVSMDPAELGREAARVDYDHLNSLNAELDEIETEAEPGDEQLDAERQEQETAASDDLAATIAELPRLKNIAQESFMRLTQGNRPAGCSDAECTCRASAIDYDNKTVVAICVNPERLKGLVAKDKEEKKDALRDKVGDDFRKALGVVNANWTNTYAVAALVLAAIKYSDKDHIKASAQAHGVKIDGKSLQSATPPVMCEIIRGMVKSEPAVLIRFGVEVLLRGDRHAIIEYKKPTPATMSMLVEVADRKPSIIEKYIGPAEEAAAEERADKDNA